MKKTILMVLLCGFIFSGMLGCNKSEPIKKEASSYTVTDIEHVNADIYNVSPVGATVIIRDTNENPYTYGDWYKIEKEENGKWYDVETVIENYGFNDIGYLVNENNEVKFDMNWEWLYGELMPGSYRVLKEAYNQYISVEFTIDAKA
ncbi:MAG: hypothetical protein K2J41_02730 [Eubacterium sp.]|nr:hypothetical protein [Eubacterium sp.]